MIKGIKKGLKVNGNICRVVIYGAGVYGKLAYDFLKKYENVFVIAWIDKNYMTIASNEYDISISSPSILNNLQFDYIIIAVKTERFIKVIYQFIKDNGVKDDKIILIDENEFEEYKKIQFFENNDFNNLISDWKDYNYLRDKYGKYVEYKKTHIGKDSNITWILWLQGWNNAPDIVIKCLNSVKKYNENRDIICLDEENLMKYINIPEDIRNMHKDGLICDANYSDIVRLELLKNYGGLWIDATVLLTGKLYDFITGHPLFLYQFPEPQPRLISSWLIYAFNNNPIIEETLKLLYIYWRTEKKQLNYFSMHFLFRVVSNIYYKEWQTVPYYPNSNCMLLEKELNNLYNDKRMEEILMLSKVHKLTYRINTISDNSFYNYILNIM